MVTLEGTHQVIPITGAFETHWIIIFQLVQSHQALINILGMKDWELIICVLCVAPPMPRAITNRATTPLQPKISTENPTPGQDC
jgi:siroheme synthase